MKLSILFVFVAIFCCIQTIRAEENEVSTEMKFWKKLEEMFDVLGIKPNFIPDLAAKLMRKRFLICGMLMKGITTAIQVVKTVTGIMTGAAFGAHQNVLPPYPPAPAPAPPAV